MRWEEGMAAPRSLLELKAALLTRAVESGHRGSGENGNSMVRALRLPGCGGRDTRKRHAQRNPQSEQHRVNL